MTDVWVPAIRVNRGAWALAARLDGDNAPGVACIRSIPFDAWEGPVPLAMAAAGTAAVPAVEWAGWLLGQRLLVQGATAALLPPLDPVCLAAAGGIPDGIADHPALVGSVAAALARGLRATGLRILAPYRTRPPLERPTRLADWERMEAPALAAVLPLIDGVWLGRQPTGPFGDRPASECAATVAGLLRGALSFSGPIIGEAAGPGTAARQAVCAAGAAAVAGPESSDTAARGRLAWGAAPPPRSAPPTGETEATVASRLAGAALTLIRDGEALPFRPGGLCIQALRPGGPAAALAAGLSRCLGAPDAPEVATLLLTDGVWRDPERRRAAAAAAQGAAGVITVASPADLACFPDCGLLAAVYDASLATAACLANALLGQAPWPGRLPVELGSQLAVAQSPLPWVTTEQPYPGSVGLDCLSTAEVVRSLIAAEQRVAPAVARELPALVAAVEAIAAALRAGRRVFYAGAGSAGRIGVLDASEVPPTFGLEPDRFCALIAGGDGAIRTAVEGAEDDANAGAADLRLAGVTAGDVLVAITAHGATPYALGAARQGKAAGATVVALVNNHLPPLAAIADIVIRPLCGPEALIGSTRLGSGSSEKLVLNCLSTAAAVATGRVHDNLMVDFKATNRKLVARAHRVCRWVTGAPERTVAAALTAAGGEVKTACLCVQARLSPEAARIRLVQAGGSLRRALEDGADRTEH